jgi:hypothetical protein
MGKRSSFEPIPLQKYYTPYSAVLPLLPHLPDAVRFIEPCAGDGRLIRHLEKHGHSCVYACDIAPEGEGIEQRDVLLGKLELPPCDMIITNPPWEREVLHRMIDVFIEHAETWLLFDADYVHTVQSAPYMQHCKKTISVGRVQWIEGSKTSGMDNCQWYLFGKEKQDYSKFYGRR